MLNKKSIFANMLVLTLAVGMLAGCGTKEAEVKDVSAVETTVKDVTFNTTKLANVIAGDTVKLSDLLYEVVSDKKQEVGEITLTYGNATITVEDGKEWKADTKETKDIKDVTFAVKGKAFSTKQVPDVNLTFHKATKTAANLSVSVSLKDKDKKTTKANVDIKVMVLPETVKPVKAITENLKLSQSLKDYDFEVRAKNIAEKAVDTIDSIKVTKSNVKFGTVGHYEVTYEIKTKPSGKLDVPTDVAVVDKSQENSEDKGDVITENVKPEETIKVTTGADVVDKKTETTLPKDSVITDSKDTTAPPAGSTSTENKTPAKGNESAASGGNTDSGNTGGGGSSDTGNSGGGSTPTPEAPKPAAPAPEAPKPAPHSHSWTPHTATKTVWVPNIVTVTDYGTQAAHAYDSQCNNCGALFESASVCGDHQFATGHQGRQNIACTHITQVVTGSHTEDHGYNTTESYVDYNYCSCGAKQ